MNEAKSPVASGRVEPIVSCIRAATLMKGCVVKMKASSKLPGYGNAQCVMEVHEMLGTMSLYGHNQHYKTYDVDKVLEYPLIEANAANSGGA